MFNSPDVWMVFKAGKLTVVEVDGVEHRMAECSLVIEPFRLELAEQLGEAVRVHLYDEDHRLRPELDTVTLDPRVPKQVMQARGAEGLPATEIRLVEVLNMTCARQSDKSGEEWIKATIRVRFDFAPKVHREWIAMYFGLGFFATFEAEQLDMLADPLLAQALKDLATPGDGITSMTFTGPDGEGVRIDANGTTPVPRKGRTR